MHLENISLTHFKSYEKLQVAFSKQVNCFVGRNGSGKTNLLDAVHYLCLTKSAFNPQDSHCIQHTKDFFSVKGVFKEEEKQNVVLCALPQGKKKLIKLNDKPYTKASEHVGKFPIVLIAPNDTDMIRGGSEERRRFFDAIISQTDQHYLQNLIAYNRVLKQRNSLLKQFAEKNYFDEDLLGQYDDQIIALGNRLHQKRKEFIASFKEDVRRHYALLTTNEESVDLVYESDFLEGNMKKHFEANRSKDLLLKRTGIGIHKDDYAFLMNDHLIRRFGSQGQQKSYLIALKLAQFDYMSVVKKMKPILLLDDIFDKLDDLRIARLMELVMRDTFGQIFVTDARPERTEAIFKDIQQDVKIFTIDNGRVENS